MKINDVIQMKFNQLDKKNVHMTIILQTKRI